MSARLPLWLRLERRMALWALRMAQRVLASHRPLGDAQAPFCGSRAHKEPEPTPWPCETRETIVRDIITVEEWFDGIERRIDRRR